MNRQKSSSGQHGGFALVFVLWMLMLAGLLAATRAERTRSAAATTLEYGQHLSLGWSAKAGLSIAMNEIAAAKDRGDAIAYSFGCRFGDVDLRIDLQDEQGKLDLNLASPASVGAVLTALGVDAQGAARLSQILADYVDADDLQRPLGAEAPQYRKSGSLDQPRNGPLISLVDHERVLGWADLPIQQLSRHFTVHSGKTRVDRQLASAELLQAINALDNANVAFQPSIRQTFTIHVSARRDDKAYLQTSVVDMPQRSGQTPTVIETGHGIAPPAQRPNTTSERSCI